MKYLIFTEHIANPIDSHNQYEVIHIKFYFVTNITNMDIDRMIKNKLANKNRIKNYVLY
jgi:hypothetical protein